MKAEEFISAIAPSAKKSMEKTGIPASFVIAEGALESAWGTSGLAVQGKNLFGVKADKSWTGEILTMNTREFIKGKWVLVPAYWRKYATWDECIDDHAAFFMQNRRYKPALAVEKDGEAFARAVAAAGYATDPEYANKVIAIMQGHELVKFDA